MNTKNKINFHLLIAIVSILLIVVCFLSLIDYMVEYKYEIDENYDQTDLIYSYKSRKVEIETITIYLKVFIVYLIVITSYFFYRLFSKKK